MSRVRTILLVEDDDAVREVARAGLERVGGFAVSTAASGEEGAARAGREHPDAVLLDVMMPGLDGAATLERLREDPETRDIPVIFLTAKVQRDEIRRLLDLGAAGVITKPFDPMTLASEVAATLGW